MTKCTKLIIFTFVLLITFVAGSWYGSRRDGTTSSHADRTVLYWHDPMHPAYKSDKPGIAPDCGMQLEPVYAEAGGTVGLAQLVESTPPGYVQVSQERQQLIGVKIAAVERAPRSQTIRLLGRVVADETRIYRINSATDGWVRRILPVTTGSLVEKDELLATFYAPEFFSAMKAYLYGLKSLDRFTADEKEPKSQIELTDANIENYRNSLRNLGMTEHQLDEILHTRKGADNIEVRAPAAGFIVGRNISPGQRFGKGTELFTIADLSHVWIVADTFENEDGCLHPGAIATIGLVRRGKSLQGRVSSVLPQFDPATRTLKVRLEAENSGYLLRPDMFVDVEIAIEAKPMLTIPSEAVLDSGLRKTVFVDRGSGFFEPRQVSLGRRMGDRVEITAGLEEAERIVISGNFLVDSESRLKLAAAHIAGGSTLDPVCGMSVDPLKSAGTASTYNGKRYYFCSDLCKGKFEKQPVQYAALHKDQSHY